MQLRMFRHMRLNEHRAFLGIESCGQIIEHYLDGVLFNPRSVCVIARKRVPVGYKKVRIVGFLQLHPIRERPHIVAEMQLSGGAHAAQDPLLSSEGRLVRFESRSLERGLIHQSLIRLFLKMSIAGPSRGPRNGTLSSTSIHKIAIPAMSNIRRTPSGRK